ncbi:MAG: transposase [Dehalococcoidia bacterium]
MAQSYNTEADFGKSDPIDATFDVLLLAQLGAYLQVFDDIFPDKRLSRLFKQAIKGILGAGVPIVSRMAAAVIHSKDPKRIFHVAKRYYRWLVNERFDHRALLKPEYAQTRRLFAQEKSDYTLVILDFSNLEKPYGYKFEQMCTLKASGLNTGPRRRNGKVPGYNELIGLAIGEKKAGLTFATTISYQTEEFVSLNREIFRAIRYSHTILKGQKIRFICDREFDDQKTFEFIVGLGEEFVFRIYRNRTLQLRYGNQVSEQLLDDVVEKINRRIRFDAHFKVGGRWRKCQVSLGYRKVWLPGHDHPYWLLVSQTAAIRQKWILLTNVPVNSVKQARKIWFNYRRRWCVENALRFLKKEGLRWEDFKVLSLEAIRRLVNLVLIAALFILNTKHYLDEPSVQFLLNLGGKLGLKSERDGPYLLLRGMQKFLICLNVLAVLKCHGLLDALLQVLEFL